MGNIQLQTQLERGEQAVANTVGTWGTYSCKHSWNVGNIQLQTQLECGEHAVANTVGMWGTCICKHSWNVGNIQLQTQLERGEHAVAHTNKIRHHNECKSVITMCVNLSSQCV